MISKKHPIANWVRLSPNEYRRVLERVAEFRDQSSDPLASGLPAAAVDWFWNIELPGLMLRPEMRVFAQERVSELNAKAAELRHRIRVHNGSLEQDAQAAEQEAARITAAMQEVES